MKKQVVASPNLDWKVARRVVVRFQSVRWLVPILALVAVIAAELPEASIPERKALDYLAREVPLWSKVHGCYSCHNNGDAARALFEAMKRPRLLNADVLESAVVDTTKWLSSPELWDHNGGEGPFSDKILARVQFASALASATKSGLVKTRLPLDRAAERLARDQSPDGSWPIDDDGNATGSPAAYGTPLATLSSRDTLRYADPVRYRVHVEKAERLLCSRKIENVMDASIALLASHAGKDAEANAIHERALKILRPGQSTEGGWGPFINAPPEPFDTSLAILALSRLNPDKYGDVRARIKRGRAFLIATQLADGSWRETTRPAGAESYAQRLSTTGWATLALLRTSPR